MQSTRWNRSRFDAGDQDPLFAMSNLVDVMLVFACGLIAALAAQRELPQQDSEPGRRSGGTEVVAGREMPELPRGIGEFGSGYQAVGRVYRDPETGKMVLIGSDDRNQPEGGPAVGR